MNRRGQKGEPPGATLAAIEGIYRSHLPEFRRAAAAITGDRELACDAVQDAFARAVRRQAGFRSEGSLNGWIWRIVINTTLSQTRHADRLAHSPVIPRPLTTATPTRQPSESAAPWRCCQTANA
jgi:RNA polymerase sigma factor (sigma-70 family)